MITEYKRVKMRQGGGSILMNAMVFLVLDVIFLFVCLDGITKDNTSFLFTMFGYSQIIILFLYFASLMIENSTFIRNNRLMKTPSLVVTEEEVRLVYLSLKNKKTVKIQDIEEVKVSYKQQFSFKSPHFSNSSSGQVIIVSKGKNNYSGFFLHPEKAKEEIDNNIEALKAYGRIKDTEKED